MCLGNITVERFDTETARLQLVGQAQGGVLGAGKDDHTVVLFRFQNTAQGIQLVDAGHRPVTLADVGAGAGGRALHADPLRVLQVLLGDGFDRRRHGGGEQRQLAGVRGTFQHPAYVVDETHAQHFVGFVEHQTAQFVHAQAAALHVIHYPAGGADDHLGAVFQRLQLIAVTAAAVNRHDFQAFQAGGEGLKRGGHLNGELAGGGQHQHLRCFQRRVQACQQGQAESGGFAGAGLRLTQQVTAFQQRGNALFLNRRRGIETKLGDGTEHGLGQAQGGKP